MIGGYFKLMTAAVFLVLVFRPSMAEIQCSDAVTDLLPCEPFLLSGDPVPNAACCGGVQTLDRIAQASRDDKRAICECFKEVAKSFPVNFDKAKALPQLCHVTVDVAIDPNVNCTRYLYVQI
ncbi:hypothetical protein CDL12_18110 [Handroanthus impetiginosus]|uniref:Non-specific lipid-transfer protein n=1 Tax=Handroanthus impetiginosus TaxID=429701 RepID=A0A2G9GVJ6_9LAMI|nr:hypothetical protein CDL12_18110 [Handroanthus impetiginosus]